MPPNVMSGRPLAHASWAHRRPVQYHSAGYPSSGSITQVAVPCKRVYCVGGLAPAPRKAPEPVSNPSRFHIGMRAAKIPQHGNVVVLISNIAGLEDDPTLERMSGVAVRECRATFRNTRSRRGQSPAEPHHPIHSRCRGSGQTFTSVEDCPRGHGRQFYYCGRRPTSMGSIVTSPWKVEVRA